MNIRAEKQLESTFKGKLTGTSVSLVVHIILFISLAVYMVPQYIEEKTDETEITLEQFEDVTIEDIDVEELLTEDETEELIEEQIETPILEVQEDLTAQVEFDEMPDMIPVESDLAIAENINIKVNSKSQAIRDIMIKKFGSRAAENGLLGTYFKRFDFFGPAHTRIDKTLNKALSKKSPWPEKIPNFNYSVIWTGRVVPKKTGTYTVYLNSSDGTRFWMNGEVIVNKWTVRRIHTDSFKVKLTAGESYDIKFAFAQRFGQSESRFEWECEEAGIKRQLIPENCMWSDGNYSMEIINWINRKETNIEKHCLRNPVLIDGIPMSHIAPDKGSQVNERFLKSVKLDELIPIWQKLKSRGMLVPNENIEKLIMEKRPNAITLQNQVFGEEDIFD